MKTKNLNTLIRVFTLSTFILGVIVLHDTGEPRPLHLSILNGITMSFILNFGLLLTSFDTPRRNLKYILVLWMILSMLAVSLVLADLYIYLGLVGIISHSYIIYTLVKGQEDEIANNLS